MFLFFFEKLSKHTLNDHIKHRWLCECKPVPKMRWLCDSEIFKVCGKHEKIQPFMPLKWLIQLFFHWNTISKLKMISGKQLPWIDGERKESKRWNYVLSSCNLSYICIVSRAIIQKMVNNKWFLWKTIAKWKC